MISSKLVTNFNRQVNAEMYSAYLYLGFATELEQQKLWGAASWMRAQAREELSHAEKFYDFLSNQAADIKLKAIAAPVSGGKTIHEIFVSVLEHEKEVTAMITDLMNQAVAENNYLVMIFLREFVQEQAEEERSAQLILDRLERAGNRSPAALMFIDADLGKRGK